MAASIDDLLNSLTNPNKSTGKLENNKDTWSRIAKRDAFTELGLSGSDLDSYLKDWIADNPYNNIA